MGYISKPQRGGLNRIRRPRLAAPLGLKGWCNGASIIVRLYVHLVFSTKYRERLLNDSVRESLHAYMATVLRNLGCYPALINSVEDHVHILMELARTVSISQAVEKVKTASSKWLKTQGTGGAGELARQRDRSRRRGTAHQVHPGSQPLGGRTAETYA